MKSKKTLFLAAFLVGASEMQAQSIMNSPLGPTLPIGFVGSAPSQEYLNVLSTVTSVPGGEYLYTYVLSNPAGDELMNSDGSLQAGTSEVVDYFAVSFNVSFPGALVGSPSGGSYANANGGNGVYWLFNDVTPGTSSSPLSFYSDLAPTSGDAQALDNSAPSPWSSVNAGGQPVLVPNTVVPVPEPGVLLLASLGGLTFLVRQRTFRNL